MRFLLLLLLGQAPTHQALFEQRRYAEAAALLEQQSARSARYLLGLCYQQLGDLSKAESVLITLTANEPNWAPAHYALARVLFMEGRFPDAIGAAETAEKQGEPKARTRHLIGSIEEERANWDASLAAYDAALGAGADAG
jgi:tetratricopeptide (TPR) repeat protein